MAILGPLEELDAVAYLRFASVYRNYESVDDFQREIDAIRLGQDEAQPRREATPPALAQDPLIS